MSSTKPNTLERLHKRSISAKDIANQFWCEKQVELSYLHGFPPTKAMDKGSAMHQQMQVEVYRELPVEPETYSDRMYRTAYENLATLKTLSDNGMARELKIYGSVNGYSIVGQIDELKIRDGKVIIVENKTTSGSGSINPLFARPHIVQVMLYRKMLEDIVTGKYAFRNMDASYKLAQMRLSESFGKGLREIGIKDDMLGVAAIYGKMFDAILRMPELSSTTLVHYISRDTGQAVSDMEVEYDEGKINADIISAMKYWTGEREAMPVPEEEKWKCRVCRFFGSKCTVWWTG